MRLDFAKLRSFNYSQKLIWLMDYLFAKESKPMTFRPVRALLVSLILSALGLLAMFLSILSELNCVDDLSEISEIGKQRYQQGNIDPINLKVSFDKEKNQWCFMETN
jgi:hypothetical protein